MFLSKKYRLVKEEEEVNFYYKLLAAVLILVSVFALPIFLEFLVKRYYHVSNAVHSNNSTSRCKSQGCLNHHTENTGTESIGNYTNYDGVLIDEENEADKNNDDYYYSDYDGRDGEESIEQIKPDVITKKEDVPINETPSIMGDDETNQEVEFFFGARDGLNLSRLGDILYKRAEYPLAREENFKILIWKDGLFLKRRHINYFSGISHDPFAECSVKNCILSYDMNDVTSADAVVFLLLRQTINSLPDVSQPRLPNQRWIFLSDENPLNTFLDKESHWSNYSGIFNWSMTYRMESDVPVANARVVPLPNDDQNSYAIVTEVIPNYEAKQRQVLMAVSLNSCSSLNPVTAYITEMQKYMDIDIYGKCGNVEKNCPTHFAKDCPELNKYAFYFAFENAHCSEYISQKTFWNTYEKGAVPIVAGISVKDCQTILPPDSYLQISNFNSAKDLAMHILHLNSTWDDNYLKLHRWRQNFKVVNEHGYFGSHSYHYCRICEALNYNDNDNKNYDSSLLRKFLSPEENCFL